MYSINSLRLVRQNIRCFSNTSGLCGKNHYDSLGITPKATQADVKGAYYKLSMVYHPDKNEGSDTAAQKFRDIKEAYEVLGNIRLRKLYDKGVSHIGVDISNTPEDPTANFYRSRERRTRPPTTGRTPIYDFDEWSRSHYGATFARDMDRKQKIEYRRRVMDKESDHLKATHLLLATGMLFITVAYFSYSGRTADEITYVVGDSTARIRTPRVD